MNLTFLSELVEPATGELSLWDKIEVFFNGFTSFFTTVSNSISAAFSYLEDQVQSIVDSVEFMFESVTYISNVTTALPALISVVFVAMLSLCIVFAIIGR